MNAVKYPEGSTFGILEGLSVQAYCREVGSSTRADSDLATEVWRLMTSVLMERKEEFPALAAGLGLNPGALHALMALDASEARSMSTLAADWKCDASNVTWLVDRLEEGGYAQRRAHPSDRRVRTVVLTPKGAKARAQVEARLREAPASISGLDRADLEALQRVLGKIDS